MMEINDEIIEKYCLMNAFKFNGKINKGAVIGKLIAENKNIKEKLKEKDFQNKLNNVIEKIQNISLEEIKQKLEKLNLLNKEGKLIEVKKEENKEDKLIFKNVKEKVVLRFEPSPSGPLHIGHAYVLALSHYLTQKYNGKLILRIADTNPTNIYKKAYELIKKDALWLTNNKINEIIIQSERMQKYYYYCEILLEKGGAYVCICEPNKFKEYMMEKKPCPCRNNDVKENLERWKLMLDENGYKDGEAVVRIKTDVKHKNPAIRDWAALRICTHEHVLQGKKYKVWPLMNFSVAIDDYDNKVTHTIRAKDHMDNERKQKFLYEHMGWEMPEHCYIGRINFIDLRVSCSKTRPLIEEGKYEDWDDIRLPFLPALRKRGYQPEAFIKYAIDIGLTQNDKTVEAKEYFKLLNHYNKEIIEPKSKRYFVVLNPIKIVVKNCFNEKIKLKKHPEFNLGEREFNINGVFYIDKKDFENIDKDMLIRLMDCCNIKKEKENFIFVSKDYEDYKKEKKKKIIHWVNEDKVNVELVMEDGCKLKGFGENNMVELSVGDIIQAERIGFICLIEKKENLLRFYFTHK